MKRHAFRLALMSTLCLSANLALAGDSSPSSRDLPPATPEKLPRWRGFNLLEKFHRDWNNKPFVEKDFRLIHELGFNFVRLPMDYRTWIEGDDWRRFREATLKEIDQAVQWGGKHGIHVCLNFHRAPGYTVASPPERTSLWTDAETQRVCAEHWALFARRYKGIPSERLSFNLFNEPSDVKPADYARVAGGIVAAIRREDPGRLVISDGLGWGTRPVLELRGLKVAQATRGYTPMELTHYKANWVNGADQYPVPTWPILLGCGTLYGSAKADLQAPLIVDGPLAHAARLRFHVGIVSYRCHLYVEADGKTVFDKDFVCGPGEGEWKKAILNAQWNTYQNLYDRDYEAAIPAGTRQIRIGVGEGDFMQIRRLSLKAEGEQAEASLNLLDTWGVKPAHLGYAAGDKGPRFTSAEHMDRAWLREKMIRPWKEAEAKGIGIMVGEFGAFNQTPHHVTLAWMEDCLKNWKEAGWGWALWNFRGSIGVLDSGRPDVAYEDFHGHKLDRKMLDLLQRY